MPQHTSDDAVLLEHLLLANRQLRAVLAGAGCPLPEFPLPSDLQQLQEEEAMALLAEENYQLRQLLQQLQHQQQLQEFEQQLILQQELELNRSGLEFDRLSPSPEPPQQQHQQPHGCSPAALGADSTVLQQPYRPAVLESSSSRGWASPAGGVLSPVAARLVAAPSLNTVQLVEAEAAAQLATQAVIQAEAEAHQHMPWHLQQPLQDQQYSLMNPEEHEQQQAVRSIAAAHGFEHQSVSSISSRRNQLQQQHPVVDVPSGSQQQECDATAASSQQQRQEQEFAHQLSSSRLAQLPQLPRLTLSRVLTGRRSQESTCSEAGRSSLCSAASGDLTCRSQAAGSNSQQPPSAATAASARSNASASSCSGLKQLTNDLLLLPPALRSVAAKAGPEALQETFGGRGFAAAGMLCADYENGARGFGLAHASAAAGIAADAAAGVWFPAPAVAAAEGSGSAVVDAATGSSEQLGSMYSPSSRAADVATNAVKGIMYPGSVMSDQGAAASAGAAPAAAADAVSRPRLRLPASVFAAAREAAAAAADLGDAAGVDQWQRGLHLADQQPQHCQQQQPQQQGWQQYQQQQQQLGLGAGLQMHVPNLPPIATGPRQGSGGGQALPPHASLRSGAAAVSQAAAAAAALAGQCFQLQREPHSQQQLQSLQQQPQVAPPQQQQLAAPRQALRLPSRVQTFQQQQQEQEAQPQQHQQQQTHTPSSWGDDCSTGVPPSLPRLRLPGQRYSAAPAAAACAAAGAEAPAAPAGLTRLQMPAASCNSCSSSPEGSPCSDSGFFKAADAGLFDGGSSGFLDAGADMFGTRISMDDSGRRLSYGEAQPSQLPEVPEDYFGLPDGADSGEGGEAEEFSYGGSQQSNWLGISYQRNSFRTSAGQDSGPLGSAAGSRELSQFAGLSGAASCEDGSYGGFRRRRGMNPGLTDTIDELAEWGDEQFFRQDTRWSGSGFEATPAAGSMSSPTSGAPSHQVSFHGGISTQCSESVQAAAAAAAAAVQRGLDQQREQELPAFPNLAPLRVSTGRTQQQEQTPPLTWQPQALRMDSGSSTHSVLGRLPSTTAAAAAAAATSPAHMAAAEAAEAAASVGLAQVASGCMDSQQLQQLLTHLARVAEEASATVTTAAVAAGRPSQPAGRAPATPVGPSATSSTAGAAAADGSGGYGEQQEGKQQQSTEHLLQQGEQHQHQQHSQPQQCPPPAAADCRTLVARGSGSDQQYTGSQGGPRPLSPFASAGINSPARGIAAGCLVLSPRPVALQRTLSAGHMAPAAGLPPKWTLRSGSSSNLPALLSQPSHPSPMRAQHPHGADDTVGHAHDQQGHSRAASAAVTQALPCAGAQAERAATMPAGAALAPAPAGTLVSPRLGLHGRLCVITHAAAGAGGGYSSNGSNSDADAGSAHTTPMHRPPQGAAVLRTNSGSSFRPAGLASITVPPSPASSGVRYVPASPRVVGFDCPLTPHAYALRSPSWSSGANAEGGSGMGCHTLACGSGSSTPRRQASSPGLLQQALSRSGLAPQQHHSQLLLGHSVSGSPAGSGCNTPSSAASAAKRAASAGHMPSATAGAATAATAAGFAAVPMAVAAEGGHGNSSNGGLKLAGSCSSNALLMTMMGGQMPMLHHQRTSSYPYLDTVQSPGSAHRSRFSASGLDATAPAEDAGASSALPAAAAAVAGNGDGSGADMAAASRRAGGSNVSSRRSSSDSSAGSTPRHSRPGGGARVAATADCGAPSDPSADALMSPPAALQAPVATAAALDAVLQLPRSVSPQLGGPRSRSVSPSLQQQQQVVSPPMGSAAEAGQHKLSRFGLAAARASTEKPLVEKPLGACSSKAGEAAGMLLGVAPEALTAVVMTVGHGDSSCGSSGCGGPGAANVASECSGGGHCASTNSSDGGHRHGEDSVLAAAAAGEVISAHGAAAAVAVPDTPAIDQAASGAAFASQHSLDHELAAVEEGDSLAGLLIEQELQRAAAEASTPAAAMAGACRTDCGDSTAASGVYAGSAVGTGCCGSVSAAGGDGAANHAGRSNSDTGSSRAAGSSSISSRQRSTWCGDAGTAAGVPACTEGCGSSTGCEGCSHHGPPASPCTPQQDAEQQQQQPLQSPDRHMQQPGQHQQQQQHAWQGMQATHPQHPQQLLGSSGSPGWSTTLPRSKSAAAYLASPCLTAGLRTVSDTGVAAAAAAAEGAGAAPCSRDSMWSPTHDVRGSGRHRSPSALLMRLSQKQVEVLMARGRASSTVPYVLPHHSSNPASALRALTSTGSADCCNSSNQGPDQSPATGLVLAAAASATAAAAAPAGNTPRNSLDVGSSSSSSPGAQQPLHPGSSWDVEQVAPPDDLFAVATAPSAATGVYIPLPRAESAASTGSPQQQQRPLQQYNSEELVGSASGSADNREVVRSAAIVQQRLKSTSKWLGPAPVVAVSAAAAEAEAAAVVTRRRSLQYDVPSLQHAGSRGGSSSGGPSSRVAMAAAALAASAVTPDSPSSLQRASRGGGGKVAAQAAALAASSAAAGGAEVSTAAVVPNSNSSGGISTRVAATAAALAASSAAAAAEAAGITGRVAGKLRPGAAWMAAAAAGSESSAARSGDAAGHARAVRQRGSSTPARSEGNEQEQQPCALPQQQQDSIQQAAEDDNAAVAGPSKPPFEVTAPRCAVAADAPAGVLPPAVVSIGSVIAAALAAAAAEDQNASGAVCSSPPCEGLVPRHVVAAEAPAGALPPAVVSIGTVISAALELDTVPAAATADTVLVAACRTCEGEGSSCLGVNSGSAAAPAAAADGTPAQDYSSAGPEPQVPQLVCADGAQDCSSAGPEPHVPRPQCADGEVTHVQDCSSSVQAQPHELQPGCAGGNDADTEVTPSPDCSSAAQALQELGCAGGDDAGEVAAAVSTRQQQLLRQRQLLRVQQQQAKRQQVAAWALAHQQQQQQGQLEQAAPVLDSTTGADTPAVLGAAAAADVLAGEGPDLGGRRSDQVSAIAALAVGDAAARNDAPVAGAAGSSHAPDLEAVSSTAAAAEGVPVVDDVVPAGAVDFEPVGLVLPRCDSMALSVADSLEVQSWAAWSTTSSINRCPKLQWWGVDRGQGEARFSQRQQRRQQRQGEGGVQGAWWKRLLQASKPQGSPAGGPAAGTVGTMQGLQ